MGHFTDLAKKAINADTAGEYLQITGQMRCYDVRYFELKEIFHIRFIQESLFVQGCTMKSRIDNEIAFDRIFDKLRLMWRERLLGKVQKEIQLETGITLKRKLKEKGIDLNATERGKIVAKTLYEMGNQINA